jgi:hypothetical protein
MTPLGWKIVGVSVRGFSHQAEGIPCQDFHAISSFSNGWILGVVSDGAGSAYRCVEGARMVCEGLVRHLTPLIGQLDTGNHVGFEQSNVRLWIAEGIELVRSDIVRIAAGDPLAAFHATLIGVMAGPYGGTFFHVGDGAAFATMASDFSKIIFSYPENGEYANETYFFTQTDWERHLRLTPFDGQFDLLALMSDGVTPFALAPGAEAPHEPFFGPLSRYLAGHTSEEGHKALAATLERDAIRRITGDDKTLVWALRIQDDELFSR